MQYNILMNKRIDTFSVKVGNIYVGSKHPIRVQSMTNTNTAEVDKTVDQIIELYDAATFSVSCYGPDSCTELRCVCDGTDCEISGPLVCSDRVSLESNSELNDHESSMIKEKHTKQKHNKQKHNNKKH